MIIRKLTLHNFGVYAGENTFEFNNEKPVSIIGGMNGRGKTTFLEAVLLSLYGANSYAFKESKYSAYSKYLESFINHNDKTLESYVELHMTMENNDEYIIRRSWNGNHKMVKEQVTVYENDEESKVLEHNWLMFIENIMPSGLSNFFFFDGEKIAALAEDDTNNQMKDAIKLLLGVNVLDTLSTDLVKIKSRLNKKNDSNFEVKRSQELRAIKETMEHALAEHDLKIAVNEEKIDKYEKKIEKARIQYEQKGGALFEARKKIENQIYEDTVKVQIINRELIMRAENDLPLILVKDLLGQISEQAKREKEHKERKLISSNIGKLYAEASSDLQSEHTKRFIEYVESMMNKQAVDTVYNLSEAAQMQVERLMNTSLNKQQQAVKKLLVEKEKYEDDLKVQESLLNVAVDDGENEVILAKIVKYEKKLEETINENITLAKERPALHGAVQRATSDFKQYVENMLANIEVYEDNMRAIKYMHYVDNVLVEYKARLQAKKIGILAETMTACFKKLSNKEGLIDSIIIEPKTLDFQYETKEGRVIDRMRLSAGEKQLIVISLLWALAICAQKQMPVIIDTPLGRLDSAHRMSILKTYFPQASVQTIILSTDSEVVGEYYDALKASIGNAYTLKYNDELRKTTIQSGYFEENVYDS